MYSKGSSKRFLFFCFVVVFLGNQSETGSSLPRADRKCAVMRQKPRSGGGGGRVTTAGPGSPRRQETGLTLQVGVRRGPEEGDVWMCTNRIALEIGGVFSRKEMQ